MRTLLLATVITLLAAACVPTVATAAFLCDPNGSTCAGIDSGSATDGCSHSGHDVLMVFTAGVFAYAVGASGHDCSGSSYSFVRLAACTDAGCSGAQWGGGGPYCEIGAAVMDAYEAIDCPAGAPPDLGWGDLLP